ncbi:MFS transporter [Sphingobium sp.]|uniref:spinster family MFS transporter n=1 Tax=Sphingobium sp. TaxID=1912891 RepID=UPI0028BE784D|nr:MFS transporter [Sphingobium sp.]
MSTTKAGAGDASLPTAADTDDNLTQGWGSRGYRIWAMGLLLLIYASNFVDRVILAALGPSIRADLKISGTQLGLLGGIAFALFYTLLGIPIARLAERRSRVAIIAAATAIWSAMTALCGTAANFGHLLLFRVGVGVGEAGLTPPAYSLISDYFPARRRASALSIFLLGIPLGSFLGATIGGWFAREHGWRAAFYVLGLPGIALALIAWITLREPPRGASDPRHLRGGETPSLMVVLKLLWAKRSFRHIAMAASLTSFANFGNNLFLPSFFSGVHHLDIATSGLLFGLLTGLAGVVGTFVGGFGTDRAGRRDRRWTLWLPAIGLLVGAPFFMIGVALPNWLGGFLLMLVSSMFFYSWSPALNGALQNMVTARMRASAAAILSVIFNLFGTGLGPVFVGFLNDFYAQRAFTAGSYAVTCPGGGALPGATQMVVDACSAATQMGVRLAIITTAVAYFWSAIHFYLAGRHIRDDILAETPNASA